MDLQEISFVLKILLLSTILSLLVKYGGQYLPISPTTTNALIIVLTPSLAVGSILAWRYAQDSNSPWSGLQLGDAENGKQHD